MTGQEVAAYREDGTRITIEHDPAPHQETVYVTVAGAVTSAYIAIPEKEAVALLHDAADEIDHRIEDRGETR